MRTLTNVRLLAAAAALVVGSFLAPSASAQTWSSTDRWGTWNNGGYTLYNNVWGGGYGPQTIWAYAYNNWGVWANHPNTGGIKSYPNVTKFINKKLSTINTLTSTVRVTTPAGGAWNSAYDIWDSAHKYETMIWLNYTGTSSGGGNVKPISYNWTSSGNAQPVYTNVSIGGATWNVFRGSNGANEVFSFLRTTKTNNTTVDIKAVLNWIKGKAWFGDITVAEVQYGWEITSSSGGLNYVVNGYSVTSN